MTETESNLQAARKMLRLATGVALATVAPTTGFPLATLATMATDFDGGPILLLSALSIHSRSLSADGRCSLLLASSGKGDPLAHPRLTLVGTARLCTDAPTRNRLRARFLAHNPKAARYADFGDFAFWQIELVSGHFNGGFARAGDYLGRALLAPEVPGLADAEAALLAAIDRARADTLAARAGAAGTGWRAIALDASGLTLAAGEKRARLEFPQVMQSPAEIAAALQDVA